MTVLFRPLGLNMTISPDTRGQIFPVKILDAAEGTAYCFRKWQNHECEDRDTLDQASNFYCGGKRSRETEA